MTLLEDHFHVKFFNVHQNFYLELYKWPYYIYVFKNWDILESFLRVVSRRGYPLSEVKEGRSGDHTRHDNVTLRFHAPTIVVARENSTYSSDWHTPCLGRDTCKCRLN